jgi:predicted nucleotidyltransferase
MILREENMAGDAKVRRIILKMVEKIASEYQPKKVILFGSYAYGEPTEDSDIDILIVTQRRLKPEETYKIRRELLRDFSVPVQLICVSEEEFTETKDVIGGITYPASKYGEILYERS